MALRPPSNQRSRDDFFSGDPALLQPPARGDMDDTAFAAALKEHARKLELARETGDWSALVVAGLQPTKFVMRPLSSTLYRTLSDALDAKEIGPSLAAQIAFRAAVESVSNLGSVEVTPAMHPKFGRLAGVELVDVLDDIDKAIVNELGLIAYQKAGQPRPK